MNVNNRTYFGNKAKMNQRRKERGTVLWMGLTF